MGQWQSHALTNEIRDLSPVVKSIDNLKNSLRGQLVKCYSTLKPNALFFFFFFCFVVVENMREAFALQKLLTFFRQK